MRGIRLIGMATLLVVQAGIATLAHADPQPGVMQPPAASRDSVLKLMQLTGMNSMVAEMSGNYEAQAKKSVKDAPKEFWKIMHGKLDNKEMTEQIIAVYQHYLSEKDVQAAVTYYQTTEGQHMLKAGSSLMQGSMMVIQQAAQNAGSSAAQEFCGSNPKDKFCVKIREHQQH
jgi:hypothetical protein